MAENYSEINSKGDVSLMLQHQMNSTYRQVLESRKYEQGRHLVKTYMIEFSPGDSIRRNSINAELIRDKFSFSYGRKGNEKQNTPNVDKTIDPTLFKLRWKLGDNTVNIYLDTEPERGENRFWIIDSVSEAALLENIINKIVAQSKSIDRIWLWSDLMNYIKRKGRVRSIDLAYDHRDFEEQEHSSEERSNIELQEHLKVSVKGGNDEALQALSELLETNLLKKKLVPSKVGIRYEGRDLQAQKLSDTFAIEDIKYDGKMVVKGTSIDLHKELVSEIRRRYSIKVREIEENHTIRLEGKNGKIQRVLGDPLYFNFEDKRIEDLNQFCIVVFSGKQPFNLWGIPQQIDDGLLVRAVDLHTGSKMNFQIYDDLISLSLEPGACGNSVIRFFTNIQQSFSYLVVAEDGDGNAIF